MSDCLFQAPDSAPQKVRVRHAPLVSFNTQEEFQNFTDWDFESDRYQGCPSNDLFAQSYYRNDQFFPRTKAIASQKSFNDLPYMYELWDPVLRDEFGPFKFNFNPEEPYEHDTVWWENNSF